MSHPSPAMSIWKTYDGRRYLDVRRMREICGARLSVLLESARSMFPASRRDCKRSGGCTASIASGPRRRRRNGMLEVTPLAQYSRAKPRRDGLQLDFAAVDEEEIRRAVRELAIALGEL